MGKSLAFLDFFTCSEIREAFVHGKVAFVLHKNSRKLLWINAKAAKFFGFAEDFFTSDLQDENAYFSKALTKEIALKLDNTLKIDNSGALDNNSKITLKGKKGNKKFTLSMVQVPHLAEDVILAVAVQKNKSLAPKNLLAGFGNEHNSAAILDAAGTIIHASKNFKTVKNLDSIVALAVNDLPHKMAIYQNGKESLAYIIKLSLQQCYLLHIISLENSIKNKSNEDGLTEIERSAFQEIAERLRLDLNNASFLKQPKKLENSDNNDEISSNIEDFLSLIASPTQNQPPQNQQSQNQVPQNQIARIEQNFDKKPQENNAVEQAYQLRPASIFNLLDTVTDGVIWLDHHFRIRQFSFAATALTCYEGHMLMGTDFSAVFTKQSFNKINNYIQGFTKIGANLIFSSGENGDIIAGNGAIIPVFVTIMPLAQGEGYAVLLKDKTHFHAQKNMATKETLLDNHDTALAETMHEIRTPLNAMIGFAEIMLQEYFGTINNPRYQRYLHDIVQSAKHILSLVNRHLEQAKLLHNGEVVVEQASIAPFDLVKTLRESVQLLEKQMQDNGIFIRIIVPDYLPAIKIDEQEFKQIIWNILANAIRFTKTGGKIVVYAALIAEEYVQISVSDNGIGMSEAEMAKAILPYGQITRKDGRNGDEAFIGTGLGLPTTKKLVEKNDGQFILLSVPNQGTTVEMSFPIFKTADI